MKQKRIVIFSPRARYFRKKNVKIGTFPASARNTGYISPNIDLHPQTRLLHTSMAWECVYWRVAIEIYLRICSHEKKGILKTISTQYLCINSWTAASPVPRMFRPQSPVCFVHICHAFSYIFIHSDSRLVSSPSSCQRTWRRCTLRSWSRQWTCSWPT